MADRSNSTNEVIQCLNEISAGDDVIETFKKEKIDLDALALLTDSELEELGISAKGDRLKLKALTAKNKEKEALKHQKEERLKELKHIIKRGKQKMSESNSADSKHSRKRRGPITVIFGWKHWSQEKQTYVQRRLGGGGGIRKMSVDRAASYLDCKKVALNLFFPEDNPSLEFEKDKLFITLGNFKGDQISSWGNFSVEKYKNDTGMCPPRIYLLTKEIDMDEDDFLAKSTFDWMNDDSDNELPSTKLLGSSSQRRRLIDEQDKAYMESLETDQEKRKKKKANLEKIKDDAAIEESVKTARTARVPPEPNKSDGVIIAIRHPALGLKTRLFKPNDTMAGVYDWCGSLSVKPLYFSLAPKPEVVAHPNEVIEKYKDVVLHVREEDEPIPMEPSGSPTVTLKGYGPRAVNDISMDDTLDLDLSSAELPDIIMVDDKEVSSDNSPADVEDNSHANLPSTINNTPGLYVDDIDDNSYGNGSMPRTVFIRRTLILEDMIKAFKDELPTSSINICFINDTGKPELGVDNGGLLRDALAGFWNAFFETCTIGEEARVPQLRHDFQMSEWKAVGSILYLGLKQLNYFPIKLAESFFTTFLFGESAVQDDDLIACFLSFVSTDERVIISKALDIYSEVSNDDIIDLLDRFQCKRLPSVGNFRELIKEIAHRELVQAAQYVIECWADLRPLFLKLCSVASVDAVSSLYNSLLPTNKKVLEMLNPPSTLTNSERETLMYLKRFVRGLSQEMLENFLRFTTGSNCMCVDKITVDFLQLEGAGRRPIAHTCGSLLQVPTNYSNYSDFRGEWSNIIRMGNWNIDFL